MAARPGEENVATLFGDIHYFYGPCTENPPHHRFDKGSYVYLFENANERRARIEIANHPGTASQDAFDGFLDHIQLRYSYKHTCLVNLTVGPQQPNCDGNEWHLPALDPHNQVKYHYRLHSLDIYFYAQHDALTFVNGIRRLLPAAQSEVLHEPGPPPAVDMISPVVQRLERLATSDASFLGRDTAAPPSSQPDAAGLPIFAPPPVSEESAASPSPPDAFVPMAYNPAAPAAPEQICHRDKTPPPDDGGLNPLHQTVAADAATPFSPGLVPSSPGYACRPLSSGFAPPPSSPPGSPTFPGPPMPMHSPALQPSQGFGSLGCMVSQGPQCPPPPRTASLSCAATGPLPSPQPLAFSPAPPLPPPQHQQSLHQPHWDARQGLASPTYFPINPGFAPLGPLNNNGEYSLHQQYYVPEETSKSGASRRGAAKKGSKWEENAGRLEKGVSGMLKRFEKKFA